MIREELAASDAGYADWWRVWAESVDGGSTLNTPIQQR